MQVVEREVEDRVRTCAEVHETKNMGRHLQWGKAGKDRAHGNMRGKEKRQFEK